jgi:hypothetical protein
MKKLFVFFASMALVAAFAASSLAADWNFYGSARVKTFYEKDVDADDNSVKEWDWDLQGNSRIGATVKTNDVIGGGFEYGTGVNVRKLYGTWNFGSGELLVGQNYTPMVAFYSDQVWNSDEGLLSYGDLYGGRQPMLQVKMKNFKVALIKPSTSGLVNPTDKMIPKIEGSYQMQLDKLTLDFFAGINTVEEDNDHDVDSFALGAGGIYNMGPLTLKAKIHIAQNPGNYGLSGWGNCRYYTDGDDSESVGAIVVGNYKMSDKMTLQAGWGGAWHDCGDNEDKIAAIYVQAKLDMAPGFFIVPEVGFIDRDDLGDVTYFGAKWQINF